MKTSEDKELKPHEYHPEARSLAAQDYSFVVTCGQDCVQITFPDLPGCVTYGDTIDEALSMIHDAKLVWISTLLKMGYRVPAPRKEADFSGRFLVRATPELHQKLAQLAQHAKVSLNQYVVQVLSERVGLAWRNEPEREEARASIVNSPENWFRQSHIDTPPKKNGAQAGTDKTGLAA